MVIVTLREERRSTVFEFVTLRVGWRRICSEEFHVILLGCCDVGGECDAYRGDRNLMQGFGTET